MLAAVHVARKQQHAAGCAEYENNPDDGLLHFGENALGPREQQRTDQRGGKRGRPARRPFRFESLCSASEHAKPAICAIARSMKTMPRASTCCPSGTWETVTSTPATKRGQRMVRSTLVQGYFAPLRSRAIVSSNRP